MSGNLQLSIPVRFGRIPKTEHPVEAKVELIRKIKNMHILKDKVAYCQDICTIISETTPNLEYNTGSNTLFFVLDQFSNTTLHMLDRYVGHVYSKNKEFFERAAVKNTNNSFMKLFNTISTELQSETSAKRPTAVLRHK
jgi:hypothetical protein